MADKDKIEVLGDVWASFSTGKKWTVGATFFGLLSASFSAGYAVSHQLGESKLATAEAKYERQLTALERRLDEKSSITFGDFIVTEPGDDLPPPDDAPLNKISMVEFAADLRVFQRDHSGKTAIQTPNYFAEQAGKRFEWTGYVQDVFDGKRNARLVIAANSDDRFAFSANCHLASEKYITSLRKLVIGQKVSLSGVMHESGDLMKCKLLEVEPPSKSQSAPQE